MKRQLTRLTVLTAALMIATVAWAAPSSPLAPKSSAESRFRSSSANVVERLERLGNFSLLLTALRTANLEDTVATGGPFTRPTA